MVGKVCLYTFSSSCNCCFFVCIRPSVSSSFVSFYLFCVFFSIFLFLAEKFTRSAVIVFFPESVGSLMKYNICRVKCCKKENFVALFTVTIYDKMKLFFVFVRSSVSSVEHFEKFFFSFVLCYLSPLIIVFLLLNNMLLLAFTSNLVIVFRRRCIPIIGR